MERKSLSSARNSSDLGLVCPIHVHRATVKRKDEGAITNKSEPQSEIRRAPALLTRCDSKRDILLVLNLEDTPKHLAPFAIERSRGVTLTSLVSVRGIAPCF